MVSNYYPESLGSLPLWNLSSIGGTIILTFERISLVFEESMMESDIDAHSNSMGKQKREEEYNWKVSKNQARRDGYLRFAC